MSAGPGEQRKAENTGVDAEDQAWYASRPDVQKALRDSADRGTWVRRGRPSRKDTGVEDDVERAAVRCSSAERERPRAAEEEFQQVLEHVMAQDAELSEKLRKHGDFRLTRP